MTESEYQAKLIRKLKDLFPGCVVLKNDPNYQQGMLDLSIFYREKWAMLEPKVSANASLQPNQEYYVHQLDEMSFAAFIFPENESEVLDALQQAFEPRERSCFSQS